MLALGTSGTCDGGKGAQRRPSREIAGAQPRRRFREPFPIAAKKNPLTNQGVNLEREKGFESPVIPVFSRPYDTDEGDVESSTQPSDASGPVETELEEGDSGEPPLPLPSPTSDLFIIAGAIAAEHAARGGAPRSRVEDMLRRAIDQAASLRGEGSMTSPADAGFELEAGRGGRCSECGATRHGTRGDSELAR